jgi:hypothetical protein
MDASSHTLLPRGGDNGAARGQQALVVTAVLTALSALIVAMRFYARLGLMKMTGREDWAILISLVRLSILGLYSTVTNPLQCRSSPLYTCLLSLPVSS